MEAVKSVAEQGRICILDIEMEVRVVMGLTECEAFNLKLEITFLSSVY